MTKKNVLVVSEQFTKGGLEVHIVNQVIGLKKDVNFVFAFGKYEKNEALQNNKVYDIGDFSGDYTISKFYKQVNQLLEIIEKEKIDVIHAHPFVSLLPAMFASVMSGKPMIYTLHGGPSLSALSNVFSYNFMQRFFFSYLDQQIISVRRDFGDVKNDYGIKNFNYIPNSMIASDYRGIKRVENNKWALLARLDNESQTAIFDIIDKVDDIGIGDIDIYGTGWAEDIIKKHIIEKGLENRVRLCGWSDGVAGALRNAEYEGVIGHAQVALDGLAAGFPVLLLSYGRVTGLIDGRLYGEIKDYNLLNIYQRTVSNREIVAQFNEYHRQPANYILSKQVILDFNNGFIQKKYLSVIETARHKYSTQIVDMWQRMGVLIENSSPAIAEGFLESDVIEEIIEECSLRYGFVVNPSLLHVINQNKQKRELKNKIIELNILMDEQASKLSELQGIRKSSKLLANNIKRHITKRLK